MTDSDSANSEDQATPQPDTRGWRWVSNPQSAHDGVISILALIESTIAVSCSIWIAVHFQTTLYILISCCVAPLLLLRTSESTRMALKWNLVGGPLHSLTDKIGWPYMQIRKMFDFSPTNPLLMFLYLYLYRMITWIVIMCTICVTLIIFTLARVVATLTGFISAPLQTLGDIPNNWKRIVLSTDLYHVPEVLPGIELEHRRSIFTFREFAGKINSHKARLSSLPFLVVLFTPSILYRFSLKSTSLIYLPFVWIIHSHVRKEATTQSILSDKTEGALERLLRWYAWVVILATAIPMLAVEVFPAEVFAVLRSWNSPTLHVLMDIFIPVNWEIITFKGWHLARVVNALLYLGVYFYADRANRRLRDSEWDEPSVRRVFVRSAWIAMFLSLYTVGCALWRVAIYALDGTLPTVEFQLWP